jgi:hypothetical protein
MMPSLDRFRAKAAASDPPDITPIYTLADHLDAALAMAEDLLLKSFVCAPLKPGDANAEIALRQMRLSEFANSVRALELALTARVLQARGRALPLKLKHPQFAPLIGLFIGGTAALADAAANRDGGLGDLSLHALASGPAVWGFFTTRHVVMGPGVSFSSITHVRISEDYLVAGLIHLGALMDLVAQFLESLELAFALYAPPTA